MRECFYDKTSSESRPETLNYGVFVGDAVFAEADWAGIEVGPDGMNCLLAYPGPNPMMTLLQESQEQATQSASVSVPSPKSTENVEAQR